MTCGDCIERGQHFRIEDYFAGKTRAWGIFQDRFGRLRRQFVVEIDGTWADETLTLVEDFLYDDGTRERRTWEIVKTGAHDYEGRADGVIGTAMGACRGSALNWRYRFALAVGGRVWRVDFDDWLFLQGDDVVINRASVRKFGLELGQVTIAFRKLSAATTGLAVNPPAEPKRAVS